MNERLNAMTGDETTDASPFVESSPRSLGAVMGHVSGRTAVLMLAALAVASPALGAQQPPDTTVLDPVVVTAERVPTARVASPATTTVITREQLAQRGLRRVAEALRTVAGLEIVETGSIGGNTALFVRGGESDYVKVLVDGVPLNDPGGAIDLADLTTDNVERIEIVRGPVSVLYGSDAVSGVVQIFTRQGEGAARGELRLRAGTHTAVEALGGVAGGAGVLGYALTVSHARSNGIYDLNNDYRSVVWSGQVTAAPNPRTSARLSLRHAGTRYQFPTDGTGRVEDRNSFQQRDRTVGVFELRREIVPDLEARLLLGLHDVDGGIDDQPDGPADTLGFFGFVSNQAGRRRTAELELHAFAPGATVLTGGVQFEQEAERAVTTSVSEFGEAESSSDVKRRNLGLYLQVHSAGLGPLSVTGGLRVDDNEAFGTFLSARAGAAVRIGSSSRVRASIGRAFKEPTFFENFADGPFARGNPALRPERSLTWEVAIEHRLLHGGILLAAAYFNQRFRDLIQYTFAPPSADDPSYFNVAAANARGVELEATATLDVGLQVNGAYTYLETEVVDAGFDTDNGAAFVEGARLLRRPTHALSLRGTRQFGSRATISAVMRYIGSRADRDFSAGPAVPVELAAYGTVDVSARVTAWTSKTGRQGLDLTARVRNVFDADYREVFGFLTAGRTVVVGLRVGL
jgi:vitamin B12 transporter